MKINNDNLIIQRFFGDEEEYNENTRLYRQLDRTLASITSYNRTSLLVFKNNVSVRIERKDFNEFNITISDPSFYQYNEDSSSKLSLDRVFYYLDYISNSNSK